MTGDRSLGEAIRLRRLELGMSQEELAERIGPDMRQSDVSRLERGKITFPRLERLNQIAAALGLSMGTLLVEAGWFTDEEHPQSAVGLLREPHIDVPIVVADDEPISLDAMAALLRDIGCTVTTAYDFESLLGALTTVSPGLVIVDVALPGMRDDALEKALTRIPNEPVLVFMGSGMPHERIEGPYLEKPIDSRQLFSFIASLRKDDGSICPPEGTKGTIVPR